MNTYNFFYREYVDGVCVDKAFYSVDAVVPAEETSEYKVLAQLQRRHRDGLRLDYT
jgi:hypothetical protein